IIAGVQTSNAGNYTVVVANSFGPTTSAPPAVLTVDTNGFYISGRVLNGTNGLSGANVVATGTNGPPRSAVTDTNGNYTITGVHPGTNSVSATLAGYHFNGPVPLTVASCMSGINFTAQYGISGRVSGIGTNALVGLTVRLVGAQSGTFPTTTDSSGA